MAHRSAPKAAVEGDDNGAAFYDIRERAEAMSIIRWAGEFQVNTTTTVVSPAIAALADGGFGLAWEQSGNGHVITHFYNADGTANGGEHDLGRGIEDSPTLPAVVGLPNGNFLVVSSMFHRLGLSPAFPPPDREPLIRVIDTHG